MTISAIKYPNRCLNHLFAYCEKNLKGSETRNPDGSVSFAGVSGGCSEDWTKCKSLVTNQVVNPYKPELEGKKLKVVVIPIEEQKVVATPVEKVEEKPKDKTPRKRGKPEPKQESGKLL